MYTYKLVYVMYLLCFQYFSPYSSVDLHKMATAFNTDVASLENELIALILDGQISARIDSHDKVRIYICGDVCSMNALVV